MALIVRNDEQIKVGTTIGLLTGSSSFTFDGTDGKPDYRQTEIVPSELNGRGILIKDTDYSWDVVTGEFNLLLLGDIFPINQVYNIHFQPIAQPLSDDHYSLVNSSFFIRDINLVNLNQTAVLERLNSFISRYEAECLRKILGRPLYDLVLSESSERITDLIYGTGYQSPVGFDRYWEGMVHDVDVSLIANYVYFFFQEANAKQTTGTGTKTSKAESAEAVSPADKMVKAWAFFASETRAMCSFLWNQKDILGARVYPEFTSINYNFTMNLARKGGVNKFGF